MFQVKDTRSRQKLSTANFADDPFDVTDGQRGFEVGQPGVDTRLGRHDRRWSGVRWCGVM